MKWRFTHKASQVSNGCGIIHGRRAWLSALLVVGATAFQIETSTLKPRVSAFCLANKRVQ